MDNGAVRKGDIPDVLRPLQQPIPAARDRALHVIVCAKIEAARPLLPALLDDETLPLSTRIRAATALARLGDERGKKLLEKVCQGDGSYEDKSYAEFGLSLFK